MITSVFRSVLAACAALVCAAASAGQNPAMQVPQFGSKPPAESMRSTEFPNAASENCEKKGGKFTVEKNGKGAPFGVCTFADNLQCEVWALLRGSCRAGGIKVTGFATPAARYCAINGGTYAVTAASNTPGEQGTCTFRSGKVCVAAAYFDGSCVRGDVQRTAAVGHRGSTTVETKTATFACAGGKSVKAVFTVGPPSSVKLALSDGRTVSLDQARTGSGARYAAPKDTMVFWNQGDTASLEERGKTTFANCKAQP